MLDQTTLFAVNALICLTGTVVFYFNWRGNRQKEGLKYFFFSYALVLVGSVLSLFAGVHNAFLALTYLGLFVGIALGLQGFLLFWNMRIPALLSVVWLATAAAVLAVGYVSLFRENDAVRTVLASGFFSSVYFVQLLLILSWFRRRRGPQPEYSPNYGMRLLGFSIALGIATQLVLLYHAISSEDLASDPDYISFTATMWFLDSWRSMFLIIGVVMMTSEVHQKLLLRMAMVDPLTGLLNRRAFERLLETFLGRPTAQNINLALLMMDIDYFKRINDVHGHEAGDAALKHFSTLLVEASREHDFICRYGGEEFLILLSDVEQEVAVEIAERFRERVFAANFIYNGKAIPLTVSIGIAMSRMKDFNLLALTRRADEALYLAKAQGRNLCLLAQ